MAKPLIIPSQTQAAPGTRITSVASGDIAQGYWLEAATEINPFTIAADGTLSATTLTTSNPRRRALAQRLISAGGFIKFPWHAAQVSTPSDISTLNHASVGHEIRIADYEGSGIIGTVKVLCNTTPAWFIEVSDATGVRGSWNIGTYVAAGKIIEVGCDVGYLYVYYDGTLVYGGALPNGTPNWPVQAHVRTTWTGAGSQPTPGGSAGQWKWNNPILTGSWAVIHYPVTANFPIQCLDAGGGLISSGSEFDAVIASRAIGQAASDAPQMELTLPAGTVVKKVRVFYYANQTQTLAKSDGVDILVGASGGTPLAITSPIAPVVLNPGQVVAVVCNYPSNELTYTAVNGGSFSGANYTAAADYGTGYIIRVQRAAETVDLPVKVSAKLTPATQSMVGGTSFGLTTNADVSSFASTGWTTTGGTLSNKAIRGATYTAPASVGTYHVYAQTADGQLVCAVTVTASGTTTNTGFYLLPEAGYSVQVGEQVLVSAVSDLAGGPHSKPVWAAIENLRVDGANNNTIILNNSSNARGFLANAIYTEGGTIEWAIGADLVPTGTGHSHAVGLRFYSSHFGESGTERIGVLLVATGVANRFALRVYKNGVTAITGPTLDVDAGASLRVTVPNPYTGDWTVEYKRTTATSWNTLGTIAPDHNGGPFYVAVTYNPTISGKANNAVPIPSPVLTGRWEKFYPPNWTALLLDGSGNQIGTLPIQAFDSSAASAPGSRFPQQARITAQAVGNGRVSAQFPSGQTAVNIVPVTIASVSAPLVITSPSTPVTVDPSQQITVTANYDPSLLTYFASGGGASFGITPATKNIYTAPFRAGSGSYYFEVRKGTETKRVDVIVRAKLDPTSAFAAPGDNLTFQLNTDDPTATVGATGGTVSFGQATGGGARPVLYTAPLSPGNYTITVNTPQGTATATVTVQTQAPIEFLSPAGNIDVEPGQLVMVVTNYPTSEVTISVTPTGGTFTGPNSWLAPTTAGAYTMTASRPGAGTDSVLVTVPLRITPKNPAAIAMGGQIQFTANTSAPTWSVVPGQGSINSSGLYTAPNSPGQYGITVQKTINGVPQSDTATVTVSGSALALTGPSAVTLQPGQTYRVGTNYPPADVNFTAAGPVADTIGLRYKFTTTTTGDPGNGKVGLNNAAAASATQVRISKLTDTGQSIATRLADLHLNDTIDIEQDIAGGRVARYVLTGNITDGGAYFVAPVSFVSQGGQALQDAAVVNVKVTGGTIGDRGSFGTGANKDLYTAPMDAGLYDVFVSKGNESITLKVTVALVITPATVTLGSNEIQIFAVNKDGTFSATGGTLSEVTGRTAKYTPGATAGNFQIQSVTVRGTAVAPIILTGAAGGGFSITFPADPITMQPGTSITLGFNIPYEPSIVLTATGGAFSGATYTAPSQAGQYIITATRDSVSDTLTVNVPLVVTPGTIVCGPSQRVPLSVNHPTPTFTVAPGAGAMDGNTFVASFTTGSYPTGLIVTAPGNLQAVVAVVIQSTQLVVYGPSSLVLEPMDTYVVSANVPPNAASYTAFGGSFQGNVYKAPDFAGDYYFIVAYEGQSVRVDVRVPLRITPEVVNMAAGQAQQFNVNSQSANWSATAGQIDGNGYFVAPEGGTVITITATTPAGSATAQVLMLEAFPYDPSYTVEGTQDREVIVAKAESGRRFGRGIRPPHKTYDLQFLNRDQTEMEAALEFWKARYPERPFLLQDRNLDIYVAVLFDSALSFNENGICRFTYGFKVIETE